MTENKRFELIWETDEMCNVFDNDVNSTISVEDVVDLLNSYGNESEQLKQRLDKLSKFNKNNREHIRLSINIETGELQRHIYATGQWFGDFDRVLCTNWITEEDYQKFIDRVIEIYNTEFKGDME